MFGEVVSVEPSSVVLLDDLQPLFVQLSRRAVSPIEMIENSKG